MPKNASSNTGVIPREVQVIWSVVWCLFENSVLIKMNSELQNIIAYHCTSSGFVCV